MTTSQNQAPQTDHIERRSVCVEVRADQAPESRRVVGYAAIFNSESEDLGDFREIIEPGAFAESLAASDVRALFNHDKNYVLARTASGTLNLYEDEKGLRYEFDAPNTTAGNDLLESLRRGDIRESSFAFTVADASMEKRTSPEGLVSYLRRIKKMKRVYDVSPVTYPAYPDTSAAKRDLENFKSQEDPAPAPDDETEIYKRLKIALEAKKRAIQ